MSAARMIGVFGQREPELAAIKILDDQWMNPFVAVRQEIFTGEDEREGYEMLVRWGWISQKGMPTPAFWRKVHQR